MSFILLGILNSQAESGVPEPDFLTSNPLWLDAADASTITESGGSVSQWDNKGTLENFSQANSADQPTTGVKTLNGLNVIDFDSEFLSGSNKSQWTFMHDGTLYFYCAVIKFGNTSNPDKIMSFLGNNGGSSANIGNNKTLDDRTPPNNKFLTQTVGTSGNTTSGIEDVDFLLANEYLILSEFLDIGNGTLSEREKYFLNNTQGSVTNVENGGTTSSDAEFNLQIGAIGNGVHPLLGQIGELIIVSGADATETNRQIVVDYLNSKWAVF